MSAMAATLLDDAAVIGRILDHLDARTTDMADSVWREPVENYRCEARLGTEFEVLRRSPVALCPSAALPEPGAYVARAAAGTPLLAVRDEDGRARVFRNACRHRGTELVGGRGCARSFTCPYHGWNYGLDGGLRAVPHEYGFPGLDRSERGLVEVASHERGGLLFVTQMPPALEEAAESVPDELIPAAYRLVDAQEYEVPVNWKIQAEGFLEGYHIRATHATTFYPRQYDNVNVVEHFGRNSRIAFPYRSIEKVRSRPADELSAEGVLTYVYQLFPNVMVATFVQRIVMVVLEPLAPDRTRNVTYNLSSRPVDDDGRAALRRDTDFVNAGAQEDRDVALAVQRGLGSGANEFLEFGRFESAIGHFHASLGEAIQRV
jgi:phenylpropionate dioxygenase-like ring-hydroxylating dioxygenase large terminal subunit